MLPPKTIQRIVRAHFDEMRRCYERGLALEPQLSGRVATRFVIAIDGTVSSVLDEDSSLPDPKVVRCVQGVFARLRYPRPQGGVVTVVYPIIFNPAD